MPDPVELLRRRKNVRRLIGTLVRVHERVDEEKPCDKICQRSRFVKKARLAGNDQLWDTRDLRRQHQLAPCHGFHQYEWNSFASAGKHDYVGTLVQGVQLFVWHVAQQSYSVPESVLPNQRFQISTF